MSTAALAGVPDALSDVTSRILSVQQRIAALTGGAVGGTSSGTSSDASTSSTFASTLAQAQSLLDSSGSSATSGSTTGDAIVTDALKYLGTPYQWGGTDPSTGLDCSGFTQRVMADLGISISRTAAQQATAGTAVASLDQAQPGDLVILENGHHVGIYVGDGKMINSPKTGDVVKIEKVWETPTAIRRVTGDDSSSTASTSSTMAAYLRSAMLGGTSASSSTSSTSALASLLGGSSDTSSSLLGGLSSSSDLTSLLGLGDSGASTGSTALLAALQSAGLTGTTAATVTTPAGTSGVAAYSSLFAAATTKYGLPSGLLAAVAQVESGGNASAVSSAGAQGLMQLMPKTAAGLGVDATNPAQAIDGAARLLKSNLAQFGTVPLALAAYNAGAGNVTKYGGIPPFAETQSYVTKVTSLLGSAA